MNYIIYRKIEEFTYIKNIHQYVNSKTSKTSPNEIPIYQITDSELSVRAIKKIKQYFSHSLGDEIKNNYLIEASNS